MFSSQEINFRNYGHISCRDYPSKNNIPFINTFYEQQISPETNRKQIHKTNSCITLNDNTSNIYFDNSNKNEIKTLLSTIKSQEKQILYLKNKNQKYKKEIANLNEEISKLNDAIFTKNKIISEFNNISYKNEMNYNKYNILNENYSKIMIENEELRMEISKLKNDYEKIKNICMDQKKQLIILDNIKSDLERKTKITSDNKYFEIKNDLNGKILLLIYLCQEYEILFRKIFEKEFKTNNKYKYKYYTQSYGKINELISCKNRIIPQLNAYLNNNGNYLP